MRIKCPNCDSRRVMASRSNKDVFVCVNCFKNFIPKIEFLGFSSTEYEIAKKIGLTAKKRWEEGIKHHPESEILFNFLAKHDFQDYDDSFWFKSGGDGDNGETLMYLMDAYFELMSFDFTPEAINFIKVYEDDKSILYAKTPGKKDYVLEFLKEYKTWSLFTGMYDNYLNCIGKVDFHFMGYKFYDMRFALMVLSQYRNLLPLEGEKC